MRLGEWKGIRLGVAKNAVVPVQLFHISEDIGETTDVASSHPEIVKKIEAIMRAEHIPSAEFPMGALDAR